MMNKRVLGAGMVLVLVLAGAVGFAKFRSQKSKQDLTAVSSQKIKGPQSARVTIVEYSDFECPACRAAQSTLAGFMKSYSSDVQLIYRHFPLPGHLWSSLAHQAAECAMRQGKFWEFHDRLYENQQVWSTPVNPTEKFFEYARDLRLSMDDFAVCLVDEKVAAGIKEEKSRGENLQVHSTPTFFINGERVVGPMELKMKGENLIRQFLGLAPLPPPPPPPSALGTGPVTPAAPQPAPMPAPVSAQTPAPVSVQASAPAPVQTPASASTGTPPISEPALSPAQS